MDHDKMTQEKGKQQSRHLQIWVTLNTLERKIELR